MTRDKVRELEDLEEIIEAAKQTHCWDDAFKFLDGYDILPLLKPGTDFNDIDLQLHNAFCAELEEDFDGEDDKFLPQSLLISYLECRFRFDFESICHYSLIVPEEVQKGTRYDTDPISDVSEME